MIAVIISATKIIQAEHKTKRIPFFFIGTPPVFTLRQRQIINQIPTPTPRNTPQQELNGKNYRKTKPPGTHSLEDKKDNKHNAIQVAAILNTTHTTIWCWCPRCARKNLNKSMTNPNKSIFDLSFLSFQFFVSEFTELYRMASAPQNSCTQVGPLTIQAATCARQKAIG